MIIFLYPLLALFSVIIWLSNKHDIERISAYIQERIESKAGEKNLHWESYQSAAGRKGVKKLLTQGSTGFFLCTQLLAFTIGIVMLSSYPEANTMVADICAVLAALCFAATVLLLIIFGKAAKSAGR